MKLNFAILFILMLLVCACSKKPITYGQGCGSPPVGWITPRDGHSIWTTVGVVSVASNGELKLYGTVVSKPELRARLRAVNSLEPPVVIQAKFEPTVDCEAVAEIRRLMSQTLDCKHGQCAEGNGHWWLIGDVGTNPQPFDPEAAPKTKDTP